MITSPEGNVLRLDLNYRLNFVISPCYASLRALASEVVSQRNAIKCPSTDSLGGSHKAGEAKCTIRLKQHPVLSMPEETLHPGRRRSWVLGCAAAAPAAERCCA